mmetsp:Transcript_21821/g.70454  ORF Transcript_21821/g.70454 Transcript_21821/m.70454 type:complete len:220 (+) Transcript_21821:2212-2871(+)
MSPPDKPAPGILRFGGCAFRCCCFHGGWRGSSCGVSSSSTTLRMSSRTTLGIVPAGSPPPPPPPPRAAAKPAPAATREEDSLLPRQSSQCASQSCPRSSPRSEHCTCTCLITSFIATLIGPCISCVKLSSRRICSSLTMVAARSPSKRARSSAAAARLRSSRNPCCSSCFEIQRWSSKTSCRPVGRRDGNTTTSQLPVVSENRMLPGEATPATGSSSRT